jgi:hypothetical protein
MNAGKRERLVCFRKVKHDEGRTPGAMARSNSVREA